MVQAAGFGRKGMTAGSGAQPAMRQQAPSADPFAAQRAAFLAAERANRPAAADPAAVWDRTPAPAAPIQSDRPMWVAYLLWFFLGQTSAHRFFLGDTASALKQLGMFVCGIALVFVGGPAMIFSLFLLIPWAIWLLADLFLIPGLHRRYCQRQAGFGAANEVFG